MMSTPGGTVTFWRGRTSSWCVVIPVLNEGERLLSLLGRMGKIGVAERADVIVVDGGSTDGSTEASRLEGLGVRGLLLKASAGRLGTQLRIGYAAALAEGYDGVVTIDGNDKDDPEAIFSMIALLSEGIDFVQASRFAPGGQAENTPLLRHVAIRWIHAPLLRWSSGFPWTDTTQGFRGYSRRLLLDSRVAPFREIFQGYELLAYLSYRAPRCGFRCTEVASRRVYPSGAVPTKISFFRGHLGLLWALLRACVGGYNPPRDR